MFITWFNNRPATSDEFWRGVRLLNHQLKEIQKNMATNRAEFDAALGQMKTAIADAAQRVIDKINSLDPNNENFDAEKAEITSDLEALQQIAPADVPPTTGPNFTSEDVTTPNPATQTGAERAAGAGSGTLPDVLAAQADETDGKDPVLAEDVKAADSAPTADQ